MNHFAHRLRVAFASVAAATLLGALPSPAQTVAPPHILWHNKATGGNKLWTMNGTRVGAETLLPSTPDDLGWKLVGTGDLNRDGDPDIVWHNEITGQNAVWYMKGATVFSGALIQSASDLSWDLVGVADFNRDGKPDLLWQNDVSGQNAVWLMNGVTPTSYHLIMSSGDRNWRFAATGDMNGDGHVDIILRHRRTGENGVWFMNGINYVSAALVRYPNGTVVPANDLDWQIVGAADYNGDGQLDLLWRHCTLGLNACWFLNGTTFMGNANLSRHEFDTDWRNCNQDSADSTWRLTAAKFTWLRARVTTSPPSVTLTFSLPTNGVASAVQRRLTTETNWTTIATGLQENSYSDSTVSLGLRYEYRVYRVDSAGNLFMAPEHVCAAVGAAPIEDRGKVLLLVDQTLSSQLAAGLDQLKQDLVGDGWAVLRYDVPRHIDDYSSATSFQTNGFNITNVIKPLILAAWEADPRTRAVFLIGHVAVPYSGLHNTDGHSCGAPPIGPDHIGAWAADMFYGDVDGTWTDTNAVYTNCNFPETSNSLNDGKFDNDRIPPPGIMRVAVGRVDFARLPVFTAKPPPGVTPVSEVALLQRYLQKDHLYRVKQLAWQTNAPPQAIVYGHFHDFRDDPIFENACHALPAVTDNPNALVVGDFCLQRTKPSLWAFLAGAGLWDRINDSIPVLEHTAAQLTDPANEPSSVFNLLLASFMGDWNLSTNNFLRSLLTTPNFGLAAMWTRYGLWRTDAMGIGEPLGSSLLRMVNAPKNSFYSQCRDLAILGDPTLRLHVLAPPAGLTVVSAKNKQWLSWSASEPGAQYYVYRGESLDGPFTRVSSAPVTGTTFTDASRSKEKVYMVRAIKPCTVGLGTYTNISQGVFASAR
jgi:hypothetical protein